MSSRPTRPTTLAILVSGTGSNLRTILAACQHGRLPLKPVLVLSDQPSAPALSYARQEGIPTLALALEDYPSRAAWEEELGARLSSSAPDLIALAGFMRVLSPACVARFAGRMVNIHPSLLPLYPGLHPHRQALQAGATEHGATVHLVTPKVDGGPRIAQIRVPIYAGDDEATLIERTKRAEHRLYPEVLTWIAQGRLVLTPDAVFQNGAKLEEPILMDERN